MADNLKDTNKELIQLENKVKSLVNALKDLEVLSISTPIGRYATQALEELNDLDGSIKSLKKSFSGIGSAGEDFEILKEKVLRSKESVNGLIELARELKEIVSQISPSSSEIILPTTFEDDSAVKNTVEKQKSAAEEVRKAWDEAHLGFKPVDIGDETDNLVYSSKQAANEIKESFNSAFNEINEDISRIKDSFMTDFNFPELSGFFDNISIDIPISVDDSQFVNTIENLSQGFEPVEIPVSVDDTNLRSIGIDSLKSGFESISRLAGNLSSSISNFGSTIKAEFNTAVRSVNNMVNGFKNAGKKIESVIKLVGNFGNRVRQAFKSGDSGGKELGSVFDILKKSATELKSKIDLLSKAFKLLFSNEAINQARKLLSTISVLNSFTGKAATQDVINWANSYERAFGLSARNLISDMQEISSLLGSMGANSEHIGIMSENLVIASRYLAGLGKMGGDASKVMSKLQSGIMGTTRALTYLGISARDTDMDKFLKSLKNQGGVFEKISTDFSSLNEQARTYVIYAKIINDVNKNFSADAFTNSLITVTGVMNMFKDSVKNLVSVLGTGLIKAFAEVAVYLIPIINYITTLIAKFFSLIGISVDLSTGLNDTVKGLEKFKKDIGSSGASADSTNESLEDTKENLDEIAKSAKKASGGLQSFDRINNITSSSSSGSDNNLLDDFDYSSLMSSMLDDLNLLANDASLNFGEKLKENLASAWDDLFDTLETKTKDFEEWAGERTGRVDYDLGFDWPKIKENLETTKENIQNIISKWGTFTLDISLKFLDDINIGAIVTEFTTFLANVTTLASTITDILIPALQSFYDTAISPIVEWFGKIILEGLQLINKELEEWNKWFEEHGPGIQKFFDDLAKIISAVWKVLEPILTLIWKVFKETVEGIGKAIRETFGDSGLGESFTKLQESITRLSEAFQKVYTFLEPVIKAILLLNKSFTVGVITAGLQLICDLLNSLMKFLSGVADILSGIFSLNPELILQGVINLVEGTWESIMAIPTEMINAVILTITNFGGNVAAGFGEGLLDGWNKLKEIILTPFTWLINTIKDIFGIHSPSTVFAGFGNNLIEGLWNGIKETWDKVKESIKAIWNSVIQDIQNIFKGIPDWFKNTFSSAKDNAIKAFDGIVDKFTTIKNNIINVFKGIGEKISEFFKPVTNIIDTVTRGGKGILDSIGGLLNGSSKTTYGIELNRPVTKVTTAQNVITTHATGGSIRPGQFFIANEDGSAELIGNIKPGQGTDVANNNMIIEALTKAIENATYNGMAKAKNASNSIGGLNETNREVIVKLGDGFVLIDSEASARAFAERMLPFLDASRNNIADTGFSI